MRLRRATRRSGGRGKVLFVAEAVTLAHAARPAVLARAVAARGWTPVMAVDDRFEAVCPSAEWQTERIVSMTTRTSSTPRPRHADPRPRARSAAVEEDLALLARVRPAVVVGDFRLSLSMSARLAGVPYINVTNAYWSPYARPRWHVPALPWTRFVPARARRPRCSAPRGRSRSARMRARWRRVRRQRGLHELGHDLLRHYTDGDVTLYADAPELVPLFDRPAVASISRPGAWSPPIALPAWWPGLDRREASST